MCDVRGHEYDRWGQMIRVISRRGVLSGHFRRVMQAAATMLRSSGCPARPVCHLCTLSRLQFACNLLADTSAITASVGYVTEDTVMDVCGAASYASASF